MLREIIETIVKTIVRAMYGEEPETNEELRREALRKKMRALIESSQHD